MEKETKLESGDFPNGGVLPVKVFERKRCE